MWVCKRGFHLSNTIRPPRPILPWNRALPPLESAGGMIPAAASLSRTNGFVNSITGSLRFCTQTNNSERNYLIISSVSPNNECVKNYQFVEPSMSSGLLLYAPGMSSSEIRVGETRMRCKGRPCVCCLGGGWVI